MIGAVGEIYNAMFPSGGAEYWIAFTPVSSGTYVFRSQGDLDTHAVLYEGAGTTFIRSDNDGGESNNFTIAHYLDAGVTYYLKVKAFDGIGACSVFITEN